MATPVEKVTAYKAADGSLHEDLADAMAASNRGALRSLCATSSILHEGIGDIDAVPDCHEAIVSFLLVNRKMIIELLGGNRGWSNSPPPPVLFPEGTKGLG